MALLAIIMVDDNSNLVESLLASCGWIFLIIGVSWLNTEQSLRIGPWITSALICLFIFEIIFISGIWTKNSISFIFMSWPIISAVIAILPFFFDQELNLRQPLLEKRSYIIILLASQILITCWFQFYFMLEQVLSTDYPSFLLDDFSKSNFIVKLPIEKQSISRSSEILNEFEKDLRREVEKKDWKKIINLINKEEWQQKTIANFRQKKMNSKLEDQLWEIQLTRLADDSGYSLKSQAIWQGPYANLQVYSAEKICQIRPRVSKSNDSDNEPQKVITKMKCQPTKTQGWENRLSE